MLEPLSDSLRKLLLELKLCSERDLRRCRRHVRRLTCDLPAFDSVWLDALVQLGRLTPFQARLLESANPRALEVGPCVAVNRLGSGPNSLTFLARPRDQFELCVTKILGTVNPLSDETEVRLQELVQRLRDVEHPSLAGPSACVRSADRIILVSRYVPGPHLAELIVRRGRFPADVVWDIGRQLIDGLEILSQCGVVHGDIRAANVRLTSSGTAVLVDTGIRPAIAAVYTVHAGLPPESCDGLAPELIIGHTLPNPRSDAYALGCLLWQLLAGRPPFPGGDPLVKLAAHQTRAIDDVCKWAPETPRALAEGIRRLTARQASERPERLSDLLKVWQATGRGGRSRLAAFRRRFESPARVARSVRRVSAPTRWLFVLAMIFTLTGAVLTLADGGARSVMLSWAARIAQAVETGSEREVSKSQPPPDAGDGSGTRTAEDDQSSGRVLPVPDRHGVIHLDGSGPWRGSEISVVGALTIEGNPASLPEIVINDHPLRLSAERVLLRNLRIAVRAASPARPPGLSALLLVQAQELSVEGCIFDVGRTTSGAQSQPSGPAIAPPTGPALVAWKLLDASEQRGKGATFRNTLLLGDGPGLYLAHAVRRAEFDNVLKLGTGPLVHLAAVPDGKASVVLRLAHTTCRASGALLRWIVPAVGLPAGRVQVEASDCVFDVVAAQAALFEFTGPAHSPEWLRAVTMTGEGSIARTALEVAAWISTEDGRVIALEASAMEVEGVFAGPFRFAGELSTEPSATEVLESEAPRRTHDLPGIRSENLPKWSRATVDRRAGSHPNRSY